MNTPPLVFTLFFDESVTVNERITYSLQTAFEDLGGFSSLILLISKLILIPMKKREFWLSMSNELIERQRFYRGSNTKKGTTYSRTEDLELRKEADSFSEENGSSLRDERRDSNEIPKKNESLKHRFTSNLFCCACGRKERVENRLWK